MSVGLAPTGFIPTEQSQYIEHGYEAFLTSYNHAYTMFQSEGGQWDFLYNIQKPLIQIT